MDVKANLASPAFTGNPTAPTQSSGNDSTRIATTAFVSDAISSSRTIAESSSNANDGYLEFRNQGANPSNPSTSSALRIFNNGGTLYALSSGGTRTSLMQTGSGNTQQVDLSGYARLSGATFTGSLNTNSNSRISGHLTIYESSSAPSSPSQNDSVRIYARNSSLFQKGQGQAERRLTTNTDLSSKANLASPTFTGSPKSTTPGDSDNSTRIATTAYVTSKVASVGTANLRGSIIEESSNSANDGYIQFRDQGGDPDAPSGNDNDDALRLYNRGGSLWTRAEGGSGTELVKSSDISGGVSGIVTLANAQTLTGNKRFANAHFDNAYYSTGNGPGNNDNSRNFASTAWVRGRISNFSSNPVNLTGNQDVGGTKTFSSAKFESAEYDSSGDVPGDSDNSRKLASTGWVRTRISNSGGGSAPSPSVMHTTKIFHDFPERMLFAKNVHEYDLFIFKVTYRRVRKYSSSENYNDPTDTITQTFTVVPSQIRTVSSDVSRTASDWWPMADDGLISTLGTTRSLNSRNLEYPLLIVARRNKRIFYRGYQLFASYSGSTPESVFQFNNRPNSDPANDHNISLSVIYW